MKKYLIILFALVPILLLSACSQDATSCEEGYILFEGTCYVDDRKPATDNEEEQDNEEQDNEEQEERHKMFEIKDGQTDYFNVPYKRVDGVTQYMDIYFPDTIKEDMPVFVYVHGGGFLWGNKDLIDSTVQINHKSYKDRFNELGYVFISVEYQKVQNSSYPCLEGQISDVKDAIKWVKLNHEDLSSSDENIGLWGLSAGGALALAAALNPDENYESFYPEISSEVKYVIDFYGVTDIYDFYNVTNYPNLTEEALSTEYWRVVTHTNISAESEENYPQIKTYVDSHSPLYNYEKTDTIVSIYHGNSDKIVSYENNSLALYNKGLSLGNEVYITTIEGRDHGFWWENQTFYDDLLENVVTDVLDFSNE